jgi:hypothetical protein
MSTKTAGIAAIDHRPDGQHRSDDQQAIAPQARVDQAEQPPVVKQERNRHQLRHRLQLAEHVHRHAAAGADLGHPLAQRRNRDLAADDDEGDQRIDAAELEQDQQRGADQELVSHRIQKCAERRGLVQPARQITVGPIGQRHRDERNGGDQIASRRLHRQIKDADDQRNGDDARPGQQRRQIEEHRPMVAADPSGCSVQ